MKDIIRILFLKNVGNYLDGENLKYFVKNNENNYIVEEIPLICINNVKNNLCYDFDELSVYNQKRYEKFYIELKKVDDNIYSVKSKTYSIKRDLFT